MSGPHIYSIRDGAVVISNELGNVTWEGRPFGTTVLDIAVLAPENDAILLLDYMEMGSGPSRNLIKLDSDGKVSWTAELPTGEPSDCYVSFHLDGDVFAHSWSCYRVRIDRRSGLITERTFTK